MMSQGEYSPLPQSFSDSDSEKDTLPKTASICKKQELNGHYLSVPNGTNHTCSKRRLVRGSKRLSLTRKICFVTSIAVCFLVIVLFLWVLPCRERSICSAEVSNWENHHDGIEFTGEINLVRSAFRNTRNLVLFFRQSLNAQEEQNGVISILGNDGSVAWYLIQIKKPLKLDCYMIDVNGDGISDCLLQTEIGLEAIDPSSGTPVWHVHDHKLNVALQKLDFPILLRDLDHDGVNELLTVTNNYSEQSKFIIISGRTGIMIGNVDLVCLESHIIRHNTSTILYSCKNGNEITYYQGLMTDLINKGFKKTGELHMRNISYDSNETVGYTLNDRRLVIDNLGMCPEGCQSRITLFDLENRKIASWSHPKTYTMKPVMFAFKTTPVNMHALRGHLSGFILKMWQWNSNGEKSYVKNYTNETIYVNTIHERVVLITFNKTDVHLINASLTEVIQLCYENKIACQPDLALQNNSLLIADLDHDGSQELISYSSTYVSKYESNTSVNWQLVSNMKVIRLESELPNLYEVAK